MLITDKLVYLEMEKTASSHINKILSECFIVKRVGKHTNFSDHTPDNVANKYVFGSIRNPWDWYVSLWAQGCRNSGLRGGLYDILTSKKAVSRLLFLNSIGEYELGFNSPIYLLKELKKNTNKWLELYADSNSPVLFKSWIRRLYKEEHISDLTRLWPTYPKSHTRDFLGLMSYRYCVFFNHGFLSKENQKIRDINSLINFDKNNNILNNIVRVEHLEQDLIAVLEEAGYQIDETIKSIIYQSSNQKENVSQHSKIGFYYDRETIDLVREKEEFLINKYAYEPPSIE